MRLFKKKTYESFIAWSKSLDRRVSSAAVILEDSSGRALIVKANYKAYWTFPGGIVDKGETPKEAALRETFEEVGITINPAVLTFTAVVNRKSDEAQTYQFIFRARLTNRMLGQIVLQSSELDEFAFVTKDEVKRADRVYGKVIDHWAKNAEGYVEQEFNLQANG